MNDSGSKLSPKADIQRKYDKGIKTFNRIIAALDFLGVKRLRRELFRNAGGSALEVAVGTGYNLRHYRGDVHITATDLSPVMMSYAVDRAGRLGMNASFSIMDAELMGFPDDSFDTVADSLTLCTFHEPAAALAEMARVCKPGGRILLLEHGKSDNKLMARYQQWQNPSYQAKTGCSLEREPLELARQAGLKIIHNRRTFMGIFHLIVATPR